MRFCDQRGKGVTEHYPSVSYRDDVLCHTSEIMTLSEVNKMLSSSLHYSGVIRGHARRATASADAIIQCVQTVMVLWRHLLPVPVIDIIYSAVVPLPKCHWFRCHWFTDISEDNWFFYYDCTSTIRDHALDSQCLFRLSWNAMCVCVCVCVM